MNDEHITSDPLIYVKPHQPGPEILTAIAKAMGEMKRLAKDNKNAEQRYDFASVDDFLAMTGPICAANGIVTLMDELSVENFEKAGKYGPTHWARYVFAITTYHASGESMPMVKRSVEVIRSGAQAAGSAQSYALKQYQRALYQIPTGDKDDPDHGAMTEQPAPKQQPRQQPAQRPAQSRKITPEEFQEMKLWLEKTGSNEESFIGWLKADDLHTISIEQWNAGMTALKKKPVIKEEDQ